MDVGVSVVVGGVGVPDIVGDSDVVMVGVVVLLVFVL